MIRRRELSCNRRAAQDRDDGACRLQIAKHLFPNGRPREHRAKRHPARRISALADSLPLQALHII
jgi:hypothetical protein